MLIHKVKMYDHSHTHISMCEIKTNTNLQKWQCSKLEQRFLLHHASSIKYLMMEKERMGYLVAICQQKEPLAPNPLTK